MVFLILANSPGHLKGGGCYLQVAGYSLSLMIVGSVFVVGNDQLSTWSDRDVEKRANIDFIEQ